MKHFSPSLDTIGLFAAGVEDVALLASLLTGRDLPPQPDIRPVEPGQIRIALYRCPRLAGADSEMQAALSKAADLAANAGFDVGEISEPDAMTAAFGAHAIIQNHEAGLAVGPDLARFRDRLSPVLVETVERGQAISPAEYDDARRLAKRGRSATRALFGEVDILLTPSAPGVAPASLETTGDPRFNKLWTLMGTPAINIPGFADAAGMPLGIQAVARFGQDRQLLAVATMLERAFRG